jgi:hypothetical protein
MTPDVARARLRRAHTGLSRRDADRHPLSRSARRERWEATHARRRTAELDSDALTLRQTTQAPSKDLRTNGPSRKGQSTRRPGVPSTTLVTSCPMTSAGKGVVQTNDSRSHQDRSGTRRTQAGLASTTPLGPTEADADERLRREL